MPAVAELALVVAIAVAAILMARFLLIDRYSPGCPSCGARLGTDARACASCGHELMVARKL